MRFKKMAINLKAQCLYHNNKYDLISISKYLDIHILISYKFNESVTVIDNFIYINDQIEKSKEYYLEFAKAISKIYLISKNKNYNEDNLEEFALELNIGEKELKHLYEIYRNYPDLSLFSNYFNLPESIIIKELNKLNLKTLMIKDSNYE